MFERHSLGQPRRQCSALPQFPDGQQKPVHWCARQCLRSIAAAADYRRRYQAATELLATEQDDLSNSRVPTHIRSLLALELQWVLL